MRHLITEVLAQHVRADDDLLVDPDTRTADPDGQPYAIAEVSSGHEYTTITLDEGVGNRNKKIFRMDVYDRVSVVRSVPEMTDVVEQANGRIVSSALHAQERYWTLRREAAELLASAGEFRKENRYSTREVYAHPYLHSVDQFRRLVVMEFELRFWSQTYALVREEGVSPVEALNTILNKILHEIVRGWWRDEEEEAARSFFRNAEGMGDLAALAERMGVPEELR